MAIPFTERQHKTIATALTMLAVLVIVLIVLGLLLVLGRFLGAFSHVFLPLAVAGVLALMLRPYHRWLMGRLRLAPIVAVLVVYLSVLAPLVLLGLGVVLLAAHQIGELARDLPEITNRVRAWLTDHLPQLEALWVKYGVEERLHEVLQAQSELLTKALREGLASVLAAGRSVLRAVMALVNWVVTPVYLAFLLLAPPVEPGALDRGLPFLKPGTRRDVVYLAREFVNILVSFFRGQLLVALGMGIIMAVGFTVVGLQGGLVLGLVLGLLNIIPYLGSMVGLALTLPLAWLQPGGGWLRVVLVLAVFAFAQLVEGYVLTPRIMGQRTGLHPMVILVAVFFWGTALNGLLGMILAIPLTAFLVVLWRLVRQKYVREVL